MRFLLHLTPLFISIMFVQLASGGLGPFDTFSGYAYGFSIAEIGLLGSAHFAGFIFGCCLSPIMIARVGHVHVFAAFVGLGIIGILLHVVIIDATYWAMFRFFSGMSIAGIYTVIESWLQARATNSTRGRIMGIYRLADLLASLGAQFLLIFLEPATYISYNILAIICCLAIFPVLFSRTTQPATSKEARLRIRPLLPFKYSPLGAVGVIIAGLTSSAFRMVSPIYGQEIGLTTSQTALFLVTFVLGGALAQYPIGALADRFDRRNVIVWLSAGAIASSFFNLTLDNNNITLIYLSGALFGFATFPIYSVAIAHANDFCTDEERVDMSAALLSLYGVGAIISPVLSAKLIELFGPTALYVFIALVHALLVAYTLLRSLIRPTTQIRAPYVYMPRTSFTIGKILDYKRAKPAAPPPAPADKKAPATSKK